MAEFLIDKDVRLSITSTVNAAFQQRFYIEKRYEKDPYGIWRQMGNHLYNGVHSIPINFLSDSAYSLWRIRCENNNEGKKWETSKERLSGQGTNKISISCNDDDSDEDFNDLVISINLIYPNDSKLGEDFYEKFDKTAIGPNGKTINDADKKHHLPELDENGKPIIPH